MTNRLDALCVTHDRAAARLYNVPRSDFERACRAMRRFGHLRDLMRMRLFAARCCPTTGPSASRDRLLAEWLPLLRASTRFERLMAELDQVPRL